MQNKPPIPPEVTPNCHPRHRKIQTTKSGTLGTTSDSPPNIDKPKSSIPLSSESKITSIHVGDTDTIEIEVLETLLPEVIESDIPQSETLFLEVIEPKDHHPYLPESLGPSSSLPLSQTITNICWA